jgi:SNF2 family DNA or RNA helicase
MARWFMGMLLFLAAAPSLHEAPVLNPATYRSTTDAFHLEVDPSEPDGSGPGRYRLTRHGETVWERDTWDSGKTIQVLAFLEGLRARKGRAKPSLVVVPRSLVHSWIEEASRFVPDLRVCDYASSKRTKTALDGGAVDVVLTTYGVLRRDITTLKDVEFGTVVLDEAQNIKNNQSQAAKASRLLRAERRIALSGTPVENHLGELWSLFEFLNPGMLGGSCDRGRDRPRARRRFSLGRFAPSSSAAPKNRSCQSFPRRTSRRSTVRQRKLYEELRRHYQRSLSERIEGAGLSGSKMWVIGALLRLRQAACHPDLLERSVFAYRLIAENTVEEKILDLQRSKRELADAILVQDGALIRNLTAEDLELLLS